MSATISIGDRFGRWLVIDRVKTGAVVRCDCGTECIRTRSYLVRRRSLGCRACSDTSGSKTKIEVNRGDRFGRWTIVAEAEIVKTARTWTRMFDVRCECGAGAVVPLCNLRAGVSTQCAACGSREAGLSHRTHGLSRSALYRRHVGMVSRCHDPKNTGYADYGGRGIVVFPAWRNAGGFERFAAYIAATIGEPPSPEHSLDRVHNDRGYEPGNLRWATQREQMRNTRRNVWIDVDGERVLAIDAAKRLGISRQAVHQRIEWGWTPYEAATIPRGQRPARLVERTALARANAAAKCAARVRRGAGSTRCGSCLELGHNARTCEQRKAA